MVQITAEKEIIFKWIDWKIYIISLKMENGIDYDEKDVSFIKKQFNSWLSEKWWIAKNGNYIFWSVRKKWIFN